MYTWHVPKFNDYVGTSMEPLAPWKSLPLPYAYAHEVEFYKRQHELLGENDIRKTGGGNVLSDQ